MIDMARPMRNLQPIHHHIMRELVDKLIYDSVDSYCAADELKLGVFRVAEDEMVGVELGQVLSADTACHCRDMIYWA